jgi:hypothetical protein
MPGWLLANLHYVVAAIITAAALAYLRRRGVAQRRADLDEGRPATFDAFLRGTAPPYPSRWRYGRVRVKLDGPSWTPRFRFPRRAVPLPPDATLEMIRRPASFKESLLTNPDCRIVVARAGQATVELAIVTADVPTALESLTSSAGCHWTAAAIT